MNFLYLEGSGIIDSLVKFWQASGFANGDWMNYVMIAVACVLLYLAIGKGCEPMLLLPIAFGMLLVNLPLGHELLFAEPKDGNAGGLLWYFYRGVEWVIFPPIIFLGIGVMTDFGPLIARPSSLLLGAAAQLGIFITFMGAKALGFTNQEAASIGIIGYLSYVQACSGSSSGDSHSGVLLYGSHTYYPAAHYEAYSSEEGAAHKNGAEARGFQKGKDYFPDSRNHSMRIVPSGRVAASRNAYARKSYA